MQSALVGAPKCVCVNNSVLPPWSTTLQPIGSTDSGGAGTSPSSAPTRSCRRSFVEVSYW